MEASSSIQKQILNALEDLEKSNTHILDLEEKTKYADKFIVSLKEWSKKSRDKRKELVDQLSQKGSDSTPIGEDKPKEYDLIVKERDDLKNEMGSMEIKMTEEIEAKEDP